MISFIVLSSAVWLLLLLVYVILLRNNTNFSFNRMFLLFSILLGLLIPLVPSIPSLQIEALSGVTNAFEVQLPEIIFGGDTVEKTTENPFDYRAVLIFIYFLGVTFFSIRFMISIVVILRHYYQGNKIAHNDYTLVVTDNNVIAFSFFKWIFIKKDKYESDDWQHIFNHEIVHIQKRHSFDNILLELLKIGFWFNPILIIYSIFLRELHEFQADANAVRYTNRKSYSELLINQLQSGVQYSNVANYFINSLIKKRIIMMYKAKSNSKWRIYLAAPLVILLMTLVYSCKSSLYGKKNKSSSSVSKVEKQKNKDDIYRIVEKMPRFPGCEDKKTKAEKESCSLEKLQKYIFKRLKYPKAAQEKGIEGIVFVQFVVRKTGEVTDVNIKRDIGEGCGEVVKNILEGMNDEMSEKWIPGEQGDEKVSVYYTLPVAFRLDNEKK